MKQALTLNGTPIKTPPSFKIERYSITKSNRLTKGKMTMELIAKKRKFICKWDTLTSTELNLILSIIWDTNEMFFTLGYVENNVSKTAVIYVGAIDTELHRTDVVDWIWKDVPLDFIEQ